MNVYTHTHEIAWFTGGFDPLGLDELNGRAEMLSRIDNKYVVSKSDLEKVLPTMQAEFDILEIDEKRAFTYQTRYFDDQDRSAYYEHHQGLRKGFKVRVRRYVDADLTYLEVKVKGKRGQTVKQRLPIDEMPEFALDAAEMNFVRDTYSGHYGRSFGYDIRAALNIRFQRMTLVSKHGEERLTIDTGINFWSDVGHADLGNSAFIVEVKSPDGRGLADRLLRASGNRSTKKCSKYCIGMATLGEVDRCNRFLPTMRKLGLVEPGKRLQVGSGVRSPAQNDILPENLVRTPQSFSHAGVA